ncbi:zinc finger BED domain-containing protein RICESLEEPER 3-like [Asparagus officinalis]|uniref:zinc finger BED domain-containing protein RICESLEEPER 3-like n=1 Tax=Asparagus officinalis TaxID=4686 RepID=UPI00098E84E0|nr:zinc finger BED domain-containing protein RICESLEEPER 3-like [Asparagus officinalis]
MPKLLMESNSIADNVEADSSNEELEDMSSPVQKKSKAIIVGSRKRKLTSKAWKMFDLVEEPGGKQYSICKKCGIKYIAEGNHGTKNMLRHMKICKKATREDIEGLSNSKDSITSSSRFNFDPDKFREILVSAIIMHDLPFQFVEYEGIRAIFSFLCEDIKHISRNTVKADVLKIYGREKNRLKEAFESIPGRINLTSDLWTSIATDGYICLTAHYIDQVYKRLSN